MSKLMLALVGLRSAINVGMILRVAETYCTQVIIVGSADLLGAPDKMSTISDFSCGALQRKGYCTADSVAGIAANSKVKRLVAATIDRNAIPVDTFRFADGDAVLLGNEYDGLPQEVSASCHAFVRIPMADVWTPKPPSVNPIDPLRTTAVSNDGQPNLNVAIAAGIICYQWHIGQKSPCR